MNDPITTEPFLTAIQVAALVLAGLMVVIVAWVVYKGRPFAKGDVFRASRMTAGNRLFPTQVLVTPTSVVHFTPQWIGQVEHSIHMAHVASVSIDTNVLFSDVYIETTGGTTPIHCRGHRKQDATRIKQLIETYQTGYYRRTGAAEAGIPPSGPGPTAS